MALTIFLAALIGVVLLARAVKPWLDARREAARQATVEYWLPRLSKGDDDVRQEAARAIVGLGPQAVVRTLDDISRDPGDGERFLFVTPAIQALAAVGADAVAGLCEGLRSPEARIRDAAAEILLEIGRPARAARDDLVAALGDNNHWVRCDAIDALGSFGRDGGPAAKALVAIARSNDANEARRAVDALGHIGPAAYNVLPALESIAAKHPDAVLRSHASLAILQVDIQQQAAKARRTATGQMKELLQTVLSEDSPAAIAAAKKLGDMGIAGERAAAGLAAMLHRDEPARRAAAATALGKIGLGAVDYVPTLESAAADDDPQVRAAVAEALKQFNPKPK